MAKHRIINPLINMLTTRTDLLATLLCLQSPLSPASPVATTENDESENTGALFKHLVPSLEAKLFDCFIPLYGLTPICAAKETNEAFDENTGQVIGVFTDDTVVLSNGTVLLHNATHVYPKPEVTEVEVLKSLVKRHTYAMSCRLANSQRQMAYCALYPYKYFCDGSGRLQYQVRQDVTCSANCICVNMDTCLQKLKILPICDNGVNHDAPDDTKTEEIDDKLVKDTNADHTDLPLPHNDTDIEPEPSPEIYGKRHSYALNCKDPNTGGQIGRCANFPFKYYCDLGGRLRYQGNKDDDCSHFCQCINLAGCVSYHVIAPICGIEDGGAVDVETGNLVGNMTDEGTVIFYNGTTLLENGTIIDPPQPREQLSKRHNYALNCAKSDPAMQKLCSSYPYKYYCDGNGRLTHSQIYFGCELDCTCQKLQSCFIPLHGVSPICGKDSGDALDEATGEVIGQVVDRVVYLHNGTIIHRNGTVVEPETHLIVPETLAKRHDYALYCADDKWPGAQKYCSQYPLNYYCDSKGYVYRSKKNKDCDEDCKCIDTGNCVKFAYHNIPAICSKLAVDTKGAIIGHLSADGATVVCHNGTVIHKNGTMIHEDGTIENFQGI